MSVLVRWATRWDRKALVQLLRELIVQHGLIPEEQSLNAAIDFALAHPERVRFAVAQREEKIIGIASLHEHYSTWQGQPYGSIEDFIVAADERKQGVGTQILEMLIQEARRRGYCRVELKVQEDNDAAWKFYEARGLRFTGYLVYAQELKDEAANEK